MKRIKYIINVIIVTLLFVTVAVQRNGTIAGEKSSDIFAQSTQQLDQTKDAPIETTLEDGTVVINTTSLGKEVIGFGGTTPLKVYIKDEKIVRVEYLENEETPSFMNRLIDAGFAEFWKGLSLKDASTASPEAISGATYSSVAITKNVQLAAQFAAKIKESESSLWSDIRPQDIAGLLVVLAGVIITLTKSSNKRVITAQLILNVAVLGFWCGSFLSLSTIASWVSSGINLSLSIITVALLCVVIILPLIGRKSSYCQIHCPMGSAQQLVGRIPLTKIQFNKQTSKILNNLRYYILAALMFMMWLGVGFDLMNYEIFSAFILSSASTTVLVMAGIFLVLSLFVHKPYCRFVCPTGALITVTQNTKEDF